MKDEFKKDKLKCGALRKFCVLKLEDVDFLSYMKQEQLEHICKMIDFNRRQINKKTDNEYLVINMDEPYAEKVKAILIENNHWG